MCNVSGLCNEGAAREGRVSQRRAGVVGKGQGRMSTHGWTSKASVRGLGTSPQGHPGTQLFLDT